MNGNGTGASCPMAGKCAFHSTVSTNFLLRIRHASSFPYCRGGGHQQCSRYAVLVTGSEPHSDLMPDGSHHDFSSHGRGTTHAAIPSRDDGVLRVLVVDDVPVFRRLVVGMVRRSRPGALVAEAGDAGEAMAASVAGPLSVVLCDYRIGTGTAADVISAVRSHPANAAVPFIVMSSEVNPEGRGDIMRRMGTWWIGKHPDPEPMSKAIADATGL